MAGYSEVVFCKRNDFESLKNDCRNAKLHYQMKFSVPSTSCLRKLLTNNRRRDVSKSLQRETIHANTCPLPKQSATEVNKSTKYVMKHK